MLCKHRFWMWLIAFESTLFMQYFGCMKWTANANASCNALWDDLTVICAEQSVFSHTRSERWLVNTEIFGYKHKTRKTARNVVDVVALFIFYNCRIIIFTAFSTVHTFIFDVFGNNDSGWNFGSYGFNIRILYVYVNTVLTGLFFSYRLEWPSHMTPPQLLCKMGTRQV